MKTTLKKEGKAQGAQYITESKKEDNIYYVVETTVVHYGDSSNEIIFYEEVIFDKEHHVIDNRKNAVTYALHLMQQSKIDNKLIDGHIATIAEAVENDLENVNVFLQRVVCVNKSINDEVVILDGDYGFTVDNDSFTGRLQELIWYYALEYNTGDYEYTIILETGEVYEVLSNLAINKSAFEKQKSPITITNVHEAAYIVIGENGYAYYIPPELIPEAKIFMENATDAYRKFMELQS